jgi:hypothetical protein
VLVVSDCEAALSTIESTWREGLGEKDRDRRAMLEGIIEARKLLGTVTFVWCPGHSGVAMNAYADAVAKAYLDRPPNKQITEHIASKVRTRPCLYGVENEDGDVELTDRRVYRETWRRASEYTLDQMGGTDGLMLGLEKREWSAIMRGVGKR